MRNLSNALLPSGWDIAPLGKKFVFTVKPKNLKFEKHDSIPFIKMDLIPVNQLYFSDYVLKPINEISSGTYFEEGDLLMSKITPCFENGKQGIITNVPGSFGIATTEVIPIKAKNGVSHLPFLAMYLLDTEVRNSLASKMEGATGRQRLAKSVFEDWIMPFPPLFEQCAISMVLAKIQAAVEMQEKIIVILKDLKSATMAKLFREGLRGEPLKQTEIGEMPESWEVAPISKYCEKPRYGYTASASTQPNGPKFLRITDITEEGVNWDTVPYCSCPQSKLDTLRLKSDDLVFARIGATTGKSFLIENCPEAVFASYLIRLRTKVGLGSTYLSCFFESEAYWRQVRANKGNNLKGGMNASILSGLIFPAPPLAEQKEISSNLMVINQRIALAVKQRKVLQSLFSSMLHLLMTGQVRVNNLKFMETDNELNNSTSS